MKTYPATDHQARKIHAMATGERIVLIVPVTPQPIRSQVEAIKAKKILDVWLLPGTGAFWETDDLPNSELVASAVNWFRVGEVFQVGEDRLRLESLTVKLLSELSLMEILNGGSPSDGTETVPEPGVDPFVFVGVAVKCDSGDLLANAGVGREYESENRDVLPGRRS